MEPFLFARYCLIASLLASSPTLADASTDYSEYFTLGADYLHWEERPDAPDATHEWTDEEGGLVSLGYTYGTDWRTRWGLFYRHTQTMYFGGTRHHAQGDAVPEGEDTGHSLHVGFDYSRTWGYRLLFKGDISLAPTLSLGIDGTGKGKFGSGKSADQDDRATSSDDHEFMVTLHGQAGLMLAHHLDDDRRIALSTGIHAPLLAAHYHHRAKLQRPTSKTGTYAALEYSQDRQGGLFARLEYQDRKYGASDKSYDGWYQPDTTRHTLGLRMGWYL